MTLSIMTDIDIDRLVRDTFLGGDVNFPLGDDDDLLSEGVCDSLGLVQIAAELEKRISGLKIADQDITRDTLGTVGKIRDFVAARVTTN